jgi:DNA end-binding protein Ku
MKSIWKGSIAFGLVNIPVQLYTAHETDSLDFTLLHKKCHTPLNYQRWCPKCKTTVSWDNTAKGIEKSNGTFLILTQEAIHELRPKKTEEISIIEFIDADQIPLIYLNKHYYVVPLKKANAAYALFVKALESLNKVAIGQFIMRDKEYICTIQPNKGYLLLTTLHYAYEVRGIDKLTFKENTPIKAAELRLAQDLIKKLSVKKFDITRFKDTFAQEIKKLLQEKTKGKKSKKAAALPQIKKKPTIAESRRSSLHATRTRPVAHAKGKR